ncbi:MAG: WXG100 family type VII secretion target [Actinomycetales bacterium]|nr:WXG100 family type VII secretion target [Actinomycetales bacterium]
MWLGMNEKQVKAEAHNLQTHIKTLTRIMNDLDGEVNNIDKSWNGDDSTRFVNNWRNKEKAQIQASIKFLNSLLTQLNNEIAQQAKTSH